MATKPASWSWVSTSLSANAQTRIGYGGFLLPMWENTGANLTDLIGGSTTFASLPAGTGQPTWGTTAEGVAIDFPNTGTSSRVDFASVAGLGAYASNASFTFYAVFRCATVTGNHYIAADYDSSSANYSFNLEQFSNSDFESYVFTNTAHGNGKGTPDTSSLFIVCARFDSVGQKFDFTVNGASITQVSTTATAVVNGTDFTLGRKGGADGIYFQGSMLLCGVSLARWSDTDVTTFMANPFDLITNASSYPGRYSLSLSTQPNAVFVGGVRATKGGSATTLTDGQWFWASNVLYYQSNAGNPDTLGLVIEAGQRANVVTAYDNVTLQNGVCTRSNSTSLAVNLSGVSGVLITRCTVSDGAGIGIQMHGAKSGNTVSYSTVSGHLAAGIEIDVVGANLISHCTVSGNAADASTTNSGIGYLLGGTTIEYCTIFNNGTKLDGKCHGIYHDASGTGTCTVRYCTVYGHTSGGGIKFSKSGTAYGNVSYSNAVAGLLLIANPGSGWTASYLITFNAFYNNTNNNIEVDQDNGTGTYTLAFYNNVLYGGTGSGIFTDGPTLTIASFTAENNIIVTAAGQRAFNLSTLPTAAVIDYNAEWTMDGSASAYRWGSHYPLTFAQWQTYNSNDAHGVNADPLFVSASTGNFHLSPGSPAIKAGVYVAGVNTANPPDMGIYESDQQSGTGTARRRRIAALLHAGVLNHHGG